MQPSKLSAVSTETKVTISILAITLAVIIVGLMTFKGSLGGSGDIADNIGEYVQTDLNFTKDKVAPAGNPHITGTTATYTGTSTNPIEITEFMDYECPACATNGEALVKQMLSTYGSRITITRRIFPVHGAPAVEVARMVLASQSVSNDAYQKLHAKVLETQTSWAPLGKTERVGFFKKLTSDLGLDYDSLVALGKTAKYAGQIDVDKAAAVELGLKATPSFIINNTTRVTGSVPLEYLVKYIDKI
jgi:protein-disulfide isomerase